MDCLMLPFGLGASSSAATAAGDRPATPRAARARRRSIRWRLMAFSGMRGWKKLTERCAGKYTPAAPVEYGYGSRRTYPPRLAGVAAYACLAVEPTRLDSGGHR